ncbi:hypothetical protein RRG08_022617 [Elysia crispata]|uniref:Uncharacterized protein n=1 Tax=Elysia crispata TaxID=231223 RepID=A0AAE0Z3J3_9GAST|nr:hypothetical protein RRG08_022617 [Elysia crispata]
MSISVIVRGRSSGHFSVPVQHDGETHKSHGQAKLSLARDRRGHHRSRTMIKAGSVLSEPRMAVERQRARLQCGHSILSDVDNITAELARFSHT